MNKIIGVAVILFVLYGVLPPLSRAVGLPTPLEVGLSRWVDLAALKLWQLLSRLRRK